MIEKITKSTLGLECCRAYLGYGAVLKLSFGDKIIFKHSKLQNSFHGEIDIFIYSYSWRLLQNNYVIIGSSDSYEDIDSCFAAVIGLRVRDIQMDGADLRIILEKGFVIESYRASGFENTLIEIYSEELKTCYIHDGEKWTSEASDLPSGGFTDEEMLKNFYSQDTTERWAKIVPNKSEKGECRGCKCYLPITGEFYFMDYGLCSNKESFFDGKVVYVGSYCDNFISEAGLVT